MNTLINHKHLMKYIAPVLLLGFIHFPAQANRDYVNHKIEQAINKGETFVENSYIIGFKQPSNQEDQLIQPPDESKRGSVPFGEHSSGQSKEALANKLGLHGEIVAILDGINAIHVIMDASEAERWRQDTRVEYVEQDQILSLTQAENAVTEKYPFYSDGKVIIPRVDTADKAGAYQAATFVYDEEINAWHLQSYNEAQGGISVDYVLSTVTNTFPAQVFLQIRGDVLSCGNVGRIDQRMVDNKFEVRIYATLIPPDTICAAATIPFLKAISLDVYGLNAGIYEYSVIDYHGTDHNGTFQLLNNNRLAECEGIGECNLETTAAQ